MSSMLNFPHCWRALLVLILVGCGATLPPPRGGSSGNQASPPPPPYNNGGGVERSKPTPIDVNRLNYDRGAPELFRSSAFFRPKSKEGLRAYLEEFPDHETVRLSVSEWLLSQSTDVESYLKLLQGQQNYLANL